MVETEAGAGKECGADLGNPWWVKTREGLVARKLGEMLARGQDVQALRRGDVSTE